ncbi:MAG: TonB-dependent receptor, partial [Bacteroidota bacterium]
MRLTGNKPISIINFTMEAVNKLLFTLGLLILPMMTWSQSWLQQPVNLSEDKRTISTTLLQLSEASGVTIAFNSSWKSMSNEVSFAARQLPLEQALTQCLKDTELGFRTKNRRIIIYQIDEVRFRLSGYLEDAQSGERLVAATIWNPQTGADVLTNNYGYFSVELDKGTHSLAFSYLGYQAQQKTIQLYSDQTMTIALESSIFLPEVVVLNRPDSSSNTVLNTASTLLLSGQQIRDFPALGGENDLMAYLHQLTGIQRGADGLGGLFVRGGSGDQNLVLLDDVPLFQPTHSLGVFSVVNPLLIRSARFYQDAYPARYAGRLSSVLDIRTKEGNTHQQVLEGEVNTFITKLMVEIPLQENKSGLLLAARRTHIDPWIRRFSAQQKFDRFEEGETNYHFYDLNLKFHHTFSEQDRFFLSLYRGQDRYDNLTIATYEEENDLSAIFYDDIFQDLSWSNTVGSMRWNHLFSNKLFANTTLTYSRYSYRSENDWYQEDIFPPDTITYYNYSRFQSIIKDARLKVDFDYYASQQHHLQWGIAGLLRSYIPGALDVQIQEDSLRLEEIISSSEEEFLTPAYQTSEWSLYGEDEIKLADKWTLNLGVHLAAFFNQQDRFIRLQPRMLLRHQASDNFTARLSLSRMNQFVHLLTFSGANLPSDLWVPSTREYGPEQAWQSALGVHWKIAPKWMMKWSAYYKYMDGILQYLEEAQLPQLEENIAEFWESQVSQGSSNSYGSEITLQRTGPSNQIHMMYAYQQSQRRFPELNQGNTFPFAFDRPHKIVFNYNQKLSSKAAIKLHWEYSSGRPITLISSDFRFLPLDNFLFPYKEQLSAINDFRLADYHRLDLSFHWNFMRKDHFQHSLQLGIYNAYNRSNSYFAYVYEDESFPADSGLQ